VTGQPGTGGQLVIAHVSDLHLGAHDPAAVRTLAADVTAARPALTVVTGDLTMRARTGQFRAARELLDRLPTPLLVVTGNHDLPLLSPARVFAPYQRYRRWIRADLDPVVEVPGLIACGLQTTPRWRWKAGRVTRRQTDAVMAVLEAAPTGAARVLAVHHPPLAGGLGRMVGRARLLRTLAASRVDLVLAGHTHVPHSGYVEVAGASHRAIEVVAGTATSRRTRRVGRSWTVIRIDRDAITVQERHQSGSDWHPGRAAVYQRDGAEAGRIDRGGPATFIPPR